ncbi:hypothetical protein JX265_010094 [Neoarthrinium moseri]|uniref:Acyltransferase 3 domain-containing protein n=1 Tax=Neoarthrinium moseri TaxID=1658444 RepID=A0A9Q0AIR8_9PEZI|nr:hypothetical protein JX265_010094 [Neoarthrinium moseri]
MPNLESLPMEDIGPSHTKESEAEYHELSNDSIGDAEEGVAEGGNPELLPRTQPRWLEGRFDWLWCLLPFFLTAALGKSRRKQAKVTSTTYMNGIRGLACVVVFSAHVTGHYYKAFGNPWGAYPPELNHGILQLPVLRTMLAGKSMVCVFFVLSGFILSYSPLRTIVSAAKSPESTNDLTVKLCSGLLRRGIRLFLPMVVLAAITCVLTWYYPSFNPGGWREFSPTFPIHMWNFYQITITVMNPYYWEVYIPMSFDHCWTLGTEYRGSLVIFMLCLAVSELSTRMRKLLFIASAIWAMYWGRWDMSCFIEGMFLAELRYCPLSEDFEYLIPRSRRATMPTDGLQACPTSDDLHPSRGRRQIKTALASVLLLFSVLVLGWPASGHQQIEPFNTINKLTPLMYRVTNDTTVCFWGSIGGFLFLVACENLPWIQWLLSTPPVLYLGDISFSFYLLHWLTYLWPGVEMMNFFYYKLQWSKDSSFYLMYFVVFILIIISSDYYWRLVDEPSVKLGRFLFEKIRARKDKG